MKLALPALAAVLSGLPQIAGAQCYVVYDGANRMIYRDTRTPIDLSGSVSEGLRARFPGARLVIFSDVRNCAPLGEGVKLDVMAGAMSSGPPSSIRPK